MSGMDRIAAGIGWLALFVATIVGALALGESARQRDAAAEERAFREKVAEVFRKPAR